MENGNMEEKMKKALVGFTILIILFLSGCSVFDVFVEDAIRKTQTANRSIPTETPRVKPTERPRITPTPTKKPTATKTKSPTTRPCTSAGSISLSKKGQSVEVCGKVTFVGEEFCPECYYGFYSYLVIDNVFRIISYDWSFNSSMTGDCIKVKDKVEQLGSKPVFVMGSKEGYDGSTCSVEYDGSLSCGLGDYIQSYSGCR